MSDDRQRNSANQVGQQPSRFDDPKQKRKMIKWIVIPVVVVVLWLIYIVNAFNW